jgi:putative pyrroloquinoline-quinone binding quinoprotein
MRNKVLIILISVLIVSCSETDIREYGNIFGNKGRSCSFENYKDFQYQLYSQKEIDSTSGATSAPLLLNNRQYILSTEDGRIVSTLNNDKLWEYQLDSGLFIGAGFAADSNNNIYTIDNFGKIYSIDTAGKLRYSNQLFNPSKLEIFNTPLALKNAIVFSSSDGNLAILDKSGMELYKNKYNSGIIDYVSAIDDERILVTLSNNQFGVTDTLICLGLDGVEKWRFSAKGFRFIKGAISNGTQIAVSGSVQGGENPLSKVFYLDSDGQVMWDKEISNIPRFLSMSEEGDLYLVSYSSGMGQMLSGIFAYSSKGDMTWKIYYDYSIPMPIYISQNELMFLASNRETYALFYLQRKDGRLVKSLEIGGVHPINFYPEVDIDGSIVFAGKETLRIIRVDETAINKILPY